MLYTMQGKVRKPLAKEEYTSIASRVVIFDDDANSRQVIARFVKDVQFVNDLYAELLNRDSFLSVSKFTIHIPWADDERTYFDLKSLQDFGEVMREDLLARRPYLKAIKQKGALAIEPRNVMSGHNPFVALVVNAESLNAKDKEEVMIYLYDLSMSM